MNKNSSFIAVFSWLNRDLRRPVSFLLLELKLSTVLIWALISCYPTGQGAEGFLEGAFADQTKALL